MSSDIFQAGLGEASESAGAMPVIERLELKQWSGEVDAATQQRALAAVEGGRVLFFPALAFRLEVAEHPLLSAACSNDRAKNISFDPHTRAVRGSACEEPQREVLAAMMARYAAQALALVQSLLPSYRSALEQARTSYRPIAVEGRVSSYKKDDRRLHVDAFPSRPTQGRRILRVFSNVHPAGAVRVWQIGEPFEAFMAKFLPRIRPPWPGQAWLLRHLHITHGRRSRYDHIMLALHDLVKRDDAYQLTAPRITMAFPAGSTWMAYTDMVLHAAIAGQYLLEQTFHLPVSAMREPQCSPLRLLEAACHRALV
jgi:hypothetical protein